MLLPTGGLHDGSNRRPLRAAQQCNYLRLFGIGARLWFGGFLGGRALRSGLAGGGRFHMMSTFALSHFRSPLRLGRYSRRHNRGPAEAGEALAGARGDDDQFLRRPWIILAALSGVPWGVCGRPWGVTVRHHTCSHRTRSRAEGEQSYGLRRASRIIL